MKIRRREKEAEVEQRPSLVNPNNGKRVCLRVRFEESMMDGERVDMLFVDNINGVTRGVRGMGDGVEREMLQNRSAFDAMVNSMVMLFGMELADVEYYSEEEGE